MITITYRFLKIKWIKVIYYVLEFVMKLKYNVNGKYNIEEFIRGKAWLIANTKIKISRVKKQTQHENWIGKFILLNINGYLTDTIIRIIQFYKNKTLSNE